ncbi:hypothetical protein MPER_01618, partial [Moniliophthora perniciosa FA553]
MGAFCYGLKECEQLFRAGVPFWYVRPIVQHPRTRVDQEVIPLTPAQLDIELAELPDQPRCVIFTGEGGDVAKARAIEMLGHTSVDFADVFHMTVDNPDTSSSPSGALPGPSRSQKGRGKTCKIPYQKPATHPPAESQTHSERDKFVPLPGPYTPDVAAVWTDAIAAIDRSGRPKNSESVKVNGGYAFPDPGMVLWQAYMSSDENKSKLIQYLKVWLDFRSVLIARFHMARSCTASVAWSAKQWRLFLGTVDADYKVKPGSIMETNRAAIQQLLGQCLRAEGLTMKD